MLIWLFCDRMYADKLNLDEINSSGSSGGLSSVSIISIIFYEVFDCSEKNDLKDSKL